MTTLPEWKGYINSNMAARNFTTSTKRYKQTIHSQIYYKKITIKGRRDFPQYPPTLFHFHIRNDRRWIIMYIGSYTIIPLTTYTHMFTKIHVHKSI